MIDKPVQKGKIYKDNAFWLGPFLGGPLVAGYFFAENFKSLGQPEKVKPTWIITIIATILIFVGIFMIPESVNIPNQVIPIVYIAIAFGLFKKHQEPKAAEHIRSGGLIHGWGRVIGIGIIGLLITITAIFACAYVSDSIQQANNKTKSYGLVVKHEIDFNESNISEKEVDEIAEGFMATGYFDFYSTKYVYAVKNGTKYELLLSVNEGAEDDTEAIAEFEELRDDMDDYFPDHAIELKLVVEYLDNVVKVLK